jgi:hypothetical protein
MLVSDAITKIRAGTLHDADDQVAWDTQLLSVVADEYRRVRRWLCDHAPTLTSAVSGSLTVAAGASSIAKSSLSSYEKLIRIERQDGGTWAPIAVADPLMASLPTTLVCEETPTTFELTPTAMAPGTYRVKYRQGAPSSITTSTSLDLPGGLEDVVVERSCAWVRQRHNEMDHVAYHEKRADQALEMAARNLKGRYGAMGQPGLRREGYRR